MFFFFSGNWSNFELGLIIAWKKKELELETGNGMKICEKKYIADSKNGNIK